MRLPDVNAKGGSFLNKLKTVVEAWGTVMRYFSAYDVVGGQTVPTSWVDVLFDTTDLIDSDMFSFANGVVTFKKNVSLAVVHFDAACQCSNVTGYYTMFRLAKDVGSGWSEVPGSRAPGYCRTTTIPYGSCSCERPMRNVRESTKIKLQAMSSHNTEVVTTANACRLSVETKIYGY